MAALQLRPLMYVLPYKILYDFVFLLFFFFHSKIASAIHLAQCIAFVILPQDNVSVSPTLWVEIVRSVVSTRIKWTRTAVWSVSATHMVQAVYSVMKLDNVLALLMLLV